LLAAVPSVADSFSISKEVSYLLPAVILIVHR